MLRSFRGPLSPTHPSLLCSTALLLAMPMPLLDQQLLVPSASIPRSPEPTAKGSEPTPTPNAPGAHLLPRAAGRVAPATPAARTARGPYALTPERRALLNTIRYAEGTWKGGSLQGYRILYGGSTFASLSRHPRITVTRRYTSAAAGAYQFLPQTWDEASARLRLKDFSPASQDQAALYLIERRGALRDVDQRGLNTAVMERLAREWASIPTANGVSHYGQPVKRADELQRFYQSNLSVQRRLAA